MSEERGAPGGGLPAALLLPCPSRKGEGEVSGGCKEKSLYCKSGQALDQAAHCSGGVPIPGGVQKTCRCGTWGHGSAGLVVLG